MRSSFGYSRTAQMGRFQFTRSGFIVLCASKGNREPTPTAFSRPFELEMSRSLVTKLYLYYYYLGGIVLLILNRSS